MKLSIDKINEVIKAGENLEDTKLKFAYDKFVKRATEANKIAVEKFNEQAEDLRIEFCSTDERGNVLRNEKGMYLFSKENEKSFIKALREIAVKELEFEFAGLLACPDNLSKEQRVSFSGILIPESKEVDAFIDIDPKKKEFKVEIFGDVSEEAKQEIKDKVSSYVEESIKEIIDNN